MNVGCIPKKLMHQAALVGQTIKHSNVYGWQSADGESLDKLVNHNWERMVESVQANIKSSNFKYRVALRNEKVNYINSYGTLIDNHTIKIVDKKGKESTLTSKDFLIATGERPKLPDDCEGVELSITSDDLFSLPKSPGKTVVVGASYVALECAGFLKGLGLDVTVMVRSILLRGFDQVRHFIAFLYCADQKSNLKTNRLLFHHRCLCIIILGNGRKNRSVHG